MWNMPLLNLCVAWEVIGSTCGHATFTNRDARQILACLEDAQTESYFPQASRISESPLLQ
jgi:hypothetical protein